MKPTAGQQQALDQFAAELAAAAGPALPGTLVVRAYECGKPRCRCHTSPKARHGPYAEWTRKIGGRTITRRLTPQQLADWQPLFDNAKSSARCSPSSRNSPSPSSRPAKDRHHNRQTRQNPVDTTGLTCEQAPARRPSTRDTPKCEDLTGQRHKSEHSDNLEPANHQACDLHKRRRVLGPAPGPPPEPGPSHGNPSSAGNHNNSH
jgi:hypothetical protein